MRELVVKNAGANPSYVRGVIMGKYTQKKKEKKTFVNCLCMGLSNIFRLLFIAYSFKNRPKIVRFFFQSKGFDAVSNKSIDYRPIFHYYVKMEL